MGRIDNGRYSTEVDDVVETDVLVVGGGPAGCTAALSARRNGADVVLLEREGALSGLDTGHEQYHMTWGIPPMLRSREEDADVLPLASGFSRGISEEVIQTLLEADALVAHEGVLFIDPPTLFGELDEILSEANVDVLYKTVAIDAVVEGDVVEGVAIANKSGVQIVSADRVVDATGDGDVAAAAGAPFEFGRERDGKFQGGTLVMEVGGIDLDRFLEYMSADHDITEAELAEIEAEKSRLLGGGGPPNTALTPDGDETSGYGRHQPLDWERMRRRREEGKPLRWNVRAGPTGLGATYEYEGDVPPEAKFDKEWIEFVKSGRVPELLGATEGIYPPPPSIGVLGYGILKGGKRRYDQMVTGVFEAYFDLTDGRDVSDAIRRMRKLNRCYLRFLNERIPGFEDAYINTEMKDTGRRESRRVLGEYLLTEADQMSGRRFPDTIAKSSSPPSAHSVTGEWGTFVNASVERPFDIPYRCLLPQEVENLLVCGRCISVSHLALGGVRTTDKCMFTGEAAGAAAALSRRLDVAPRDLDVRFLQKRLLEQDMQLFFEDEEEKENAALNAPSLEERIAGNEPE